jgi:nucleotide-binding universal stress UspA family protein
MPRRAPLTTEEIELVDKLVELNREEATKYLAQLEPRLPGEVQTQVIISDYTIGALHDLIDDNGLDLVLLSAHGYSGQNKRPYGSVVTSFIVYGTTPLLIVQDLKPGAIGSTQAEMMASHMGNGVGMRTTIHAKPAF